MKALLIFISTILILILSTTMSGYVLSVLWGWFIIPVFSLPALSIPYAIGLSVIVGKLTHQVIPDDDSKDSTDNLISKLTLSLTLPLMYLAMGYLVTLFI